MLKVELRIITITSLRILGLVLSYFVCFLRSFKSAVPDNDATERGSK